MIDEIEGVISDIEGGDVDEVDIATLRRAQIEIEKLRHDRWMVSALWRLLNEAGGFPSSTDLIEAEKRAKKATAEYVTSNPSPGYHYVIRRSDESVVGTFHHWRDASKRVLELISGVKTKRPELYACMKSMRKGDTLIVWRLDRLGRSVPELIKLMVDMQERGIEFRSLTEAIDTSTAAGKMVFHMLAAFAEFERNLISERTKAGLKATRARGHRGGRKPKVTPKKMRIVKSLLLDPTVIMQEAADAIGVSRAAVYRALAREKEEENARALKKAVKQIETKI